MKKTFALGFLLIIIMSFFSGMFMAAGFHEAMALVAAPESPTVPTPEIKQPVAIVEPEKVYLGKFVVTGYCPCESCTGKKKSDPAYGITASGTNAEEGETVGADPGLFEMGERIEIEGIGERSIEDVPAPWIMKKYRGHILDLYFGTHEEAQAFGKQVLDVWVYRQ